MKENKGRLLSLDALRGFDMFFIMGGELVLLSLFALFPGDFSEWGTEQLRHKSWDGFSFYDLIFPLFLFLAGLSFPFSLAKQREAGRKESSIYLKILKRGFLLVLLGAIYNGLLQLDFENMRYASVLGRIGLAWMFAALLYVSFGRKVSIAFSVAILLGYWALLALSVAPDAPAGASPFSLEGSIVGYFDRCCLPGVMHLGIFDPEGLLSTLPAIVTALLGIFTGEFVRSKKIGSEYRKVWIMLAASAAFLLAGYIWDSVFPINKNLWTSSFVCWTAGWSLLLFSVFYLVIDVMGFRRWSFFFSVIGVNSITIYLLPQFFDFSKPVNAIFGGVIRLLPEDYHHLGYYCCLVAVSWILLYFLYRKKVFLKV